MSALQASLVHAAGVTAGMPFVLKLTLQSHSPLLQTLEVVLKDSTGFVISGESQWNLNNASVKHVGTYTYGCAHVVLCNCSAHWVRHAFFEPAECRIGAGSAVRLWVNATGLLYDLFRHHAPEFKRL